LWVPSEGTLQNRTPRKNPIHWVEKRLFDDLLKQAKLKSERSQAATSPLCSDFITLNPRQVLLCRKKREYEMIPSNDIRCAYDPEILTIMANALDRACDSFPVHFRDSDQLRRRLAFHIIRQINDGEDDATRLANSAIFSLLW
jgi:hypothetical protein